jgi:putative membrane protein
MAMTRMQVYALGAAVALTPVSLLAQLPSSTSQNPQNPATPAVASANPSPYGTDSSVGGGLAITDPQTMKDKMFLRKVTQGGYAEVQLGQLAAQKGSSDDVKKFGQWMADDHTMLNNNMKPIARSVGIMEPTKLNKSDQAEFDKLSGLSGTDFDKEYLAFVSKDHHKDLQVFEDEEAAASDPDLKDACAMAERVIARHTRYVDRLAAKNGVPVPPPPPTK